MKYKRWSRWITLLYCMFFLFGDTAFIQANESNSSLTIQHTHGAVPIEAYRVAYKSDNTYVLTDSFSNLSIDLSNIEVVGVGEETDYFVVSSSQSRLSSPVANTIYGHIRKENIEPDYIKNLDEYGQGTFQKMKDGIYLITSTPYKTEEGTWFTNPTTIELNSKDSLVISLKPSLYFTEAEVLSIEKVWKNEEGKVSTDIVVSEIEAEIYQDGELFQTVKLNKANNWKTELWLSGIAGHWTVCEKDVPSDYTLLVSQNDAKFVLTNTKKKSSPEDPSFHDPSHTDQATDANNPAHKTDQSISTGQITGVELFAFLAALSALAYRKIQKRYYS